MSGRSGARRLGVSGALVDGVLVPGDVEVTHDAVSAVGLHPGRGALLALPGLVDLQVNGFAGIDLLTADVAGYGHAAEALARTGVTTYQPTFVTSPPEVTAAALATLARVRAQPQNGARALAAHLEGPFISPVRCGAHDARHITPPSIAAADALCGAGPVGMMTLAPEIDGALAVIAHLRRRGIVVSLGHSDATSSIAGAAFDAGATAVTHILNAMRPITARDPGLAGVAMTRADVAVMAIIDGVHLAAETVSILIGAVRGRLCLVTDAIEAAGEGDGDFRLGGRPVHVTGGEVRLDDGTLAGSVLTMNAAVRNLVAHGLRIDEAVDAATRVPAGVIGDLAAGRLHVGGRADIAVVDGAFEVHRTLVGGIEVYAR
jgi:N-acetylglucosamine-6-phosphate deacetylase